MVMVMKVLAEMATWQSPSLQGVIMSKALLSGNRVLAERTRLEKITDRSAMQRITKRSLNIFLIVLKTVFLENIKYMIRIEITDSENQI